MKKAVVSVIFVVNLFIQCMVVNTTEGAVNTAPYLQNVKQTGITIMWELTGTESCEVQYGLDTGYGYTASATYQDSGGGTYVYKSVLTGLNPNTTYHFRVMAGGISQGDQTFTTAPTAKPAFSFGVWADSQGTNDPPPAEVPSPYPADLYEPTKSMMAHMGNDSDIQFGVAVGDLTEHGEDYGMVEEFFLERVCNYLGQKKPFFIAWGNHDLGGTDSYIRRFADLPSKDRESPYTAGFGNYSFDYAGCHFVCIDDDYERDIERFDMAWVESDLQQAQANGARFIFLFVHRAPYYERWYDGESFLRDNLVPLMETYGVDVCFSGHVHGYLRGYQNGVYYCVTGGGSWLVDYIPLVYNWPHMTVGGYNDSGSSVGNGMINEYVKVEVDDQGFTATLVPFNPDGSLMAGVSDTFSKNEPLTDPPIIVEIDPDPDTDSFAGIEYTRQLQLSQGNPPVTWSVVQGSTGLQVDSSGYVNGWTPGGMRCKYSDYYRDTGAKQLWFRHRDMAGRAKGILPAG